MSSDKKKARKSTFDRTQVIIGEMVHPPKIPVVQRIIGLVISAAGIYALKHIDIKIQYSILGVCFGFVMAFPIQVKYSAKLFASIVSDIVGAFKGSK